MNLLKMKPTTKKATLIALDSVLYFSAILIAIMLRFEAVPPSGYIEEVLPHVAWMIPLYIVSLAAFGFYKTLWRFAGMPETMRFVGIGLLSGALIYVLNLVFTPGLSRSIIILQSVIGIFLVACSRVGYWAYLTYNINFAKPAPEHSSAVMIVGAGYAGVQALSLVRSERGGTAYPAIFVDDDPTKQKQRIHNVIVQGTLPEIPELVEKFSVQEILIAIPSLSGEKLRDLISLCNKTKRKLRVLSSPHSYTGKSETRVKFRELNLTDFLQRDEVTLQMDSISAYVRGKTVLVTGGGGSIGSAICRQIMRFAPKHLLIFDIYENCAYELLHELLQRHGADIPIHVLIGSIRDKGRLDEVFKTYGPDIVFHAAAHKHVPLMEENPSEAVKNNVFGTLNLLEAASENGVERIVQLSTDKAVYPTNVMGATKRICEMLMQDFARRGAMKCMSVRFGNVLGSHGSVLPLFDAQIRAGGPVTITHEAMTRYFMTIPEAAQLVLQAGGIAKSGAIFVLDMGQPIRIMELAEQLIRFYGYEPDIDIPISVIGLRPGEKLHEELLMAEEQSEIVKTDYEKIMIAPPLQIDSETLYEQLRTLKAAVEGHSERVRAILKEIVPGYQLEPFKAARAEQADEEETNPQPFVSVG